MSERKKRKGYGRNPAPQTPPELLLSRAEQEEMVRIWRPLACKLAMIYWKMNRRWESPEVLVEVGVSGLWEAATRFVPSKGFKFMTYGGWYVKKAIREHLYAVKGISRSAAQNDKKIVRLANRTASIDVPSEMHPNGMAETIADRHRKPELEFPEDFWERVGKFLSPSEKLVIRLRFHDGITLAEAGDVLGVSRERVRQLEARSLIKIRKYVDFGDCLDQFSFTERAIG